MRDKSKIGIYNKYTVLRTDGADSPGGKHENCDLFVLDLTHDPFAIPAIVAYANACESSYPVLSSELKEKASTVPPTDEQLIKQLEEAGFKPDYTGVWDSHIITIGRNEVEIYKCDEQISRVQITDTNDGHSVVLSCKDLASAVRLGLTLCEVVK